jgi:hypothetical protein
VLGRNGKREEHLAVIFSPDSEIVQPEDFHPRSGGRNVAANLVAALGVSTKYRQFPEAKHSPVLSADLLIDGQRFAVAALGPEHVIVRLPRLVPAGEGTILFRADDEVTTYHIDLPQGIDPARHEQSYRLLKTA